MNIREFTEKWGTEGWRLLIERHIDKLMFDRDCDQKLADEVLRLLNDLQSALESENNTRADTFAECAEYCENMIGFLLTVPERSPTIIRMIVAPNLDDLYRHFFSSFRKCLPASS